jgi:uncharacterized protein YgbK (DUF1537 family)
LVIRRPLYPGYHLSIARLTEKLAMKIEKNALFSRLPPEWPEDLVSRISAQVKTSTIKIVVLDDDPTGTQTVRDVTVLTCWDENSLRNVLNESDAIVYILTNTRSVALSEAQAINREIARRLKQAHRSTGRSFSVISRSDSTLRGHFPGEVEALVEELGEVTDGILVIPFFEEGGRFTINNVHYVAEGEMLFPAGETDYAQDATFGYHSSDLRKWVCEKYQGKIIVGDVGTISLDTIRRGGPDAVASSLYHLEKSKVCVVNAASYRDLEVFVAGLLQAERAGKHFISRTAASFVRVRGGLRSSPLLSRTEIDIVDRKVGGLVIAGSHVRKSSEQIEAVQFLPGIVSLEVLVTELLDEPNRRTEVRRIRRQADQALVEGSDVLVYTSRQLVTGPTAGASLEISRSVSNALAEIVQGLQARPSWIIAKGGITASDIATKGLQTKWARVMGQILPGVPVWRLGTECRWPGMIYVVFPGNVGGPDSIVEIVQHFRERG